MGYMGVPYDGGEFSSHPQVLAILSLHNKL